MLVFKRSIVNFCLIFTCCFLKYTYIVHFKYLKVTYENKNNRVF